MEQVTMEEVKQLKKAMETRILVALSEFTNKTGLLVSDIAICTAEMSHDTVYLQVKAEIKL